MARIATTQLPDLAVTATGEAQTPAQSINGCHSPLASEPTIATTKALLSLTTVSKQRWVPAGGLQSTMRLSLSALSLSSVLR